MQVNYLVVFLSLPVLIYCNSYPSLSCLLACDKYPCPGEDDCEHGNVDDRCQCCEDGVCAKGINEDCEGKWNHAGTCAVGLMCESVFPRFPQLPGVCKPNPDQNYDTY